MADIYFASPPDMSRPASGPSFTASQQLQTRTLLLRRLPLELVLPILHLASYYAVVVSWREGQVSVASPKKIPYLVSSLTKGRVESVRMSVRAMDQGYMVPPRIGGGHQRGLEAAEETTGKKTTSHSYFETYLLRGLGEGEEVEGSRKVLFENRYAFPRPLVHTTTFSRLSPSPSSASASDPDLAGLITQAHPGDRFAIDVVADRSWWVNIVESARIELSVSYFHPSAFAFIDGAEGEVEEGT